METPLDVTQGNKRRQQLLQQLARQSGFQQRPAARPVFGAGRPFFAPGNLPAAPIPQLTRPFPLPPGLQQRLGPGAVGFPGPGEFSPGPGMPALPPQAHPQMPSPPGPPPQGAPNGGSAPGANRTLYEGGGSPIDAPGGPVDGMGTPLAPLQTPAPGHGSATGALGSENPQQDIANFVAQTGAQGTPDYQSAFGGDSGLIPLGGGQYLDPNSGQVHGLGTPTMGTAVRGLFMQ